MEENLGWSRGKAKVGIDALDNIQSIDIDRHSITGESILLLLFVFCHFLMKVFYTRKRGSASYIVREVHSVREREREREIQRQTEVTSPFSC